MHLSSASRTRPVTFQALVAAGLLIAACDRSAPPPTSGTESAPAAVGGDLTGLWKVAFQRGDSSVVGHIALFPSELLRDSVESQLGRGVTQGTYDVRFEPLGFTVAGDAALQPAVSELRGDSAEVVLNPSVGHGRIVMRGRYAEGSVQGTWHYDGQGGADGTFVLQRVP